MAHICRGAPHSTAARAAGMTNGQALEALQRNEVAETVAAMRRRLDESLGEVITRDFIGGMILDSHRRAATATEELTAARDLAKLYGLNAPERAVQVVYNVSRVEQLEHMSDEELVRIAGITPDTVRQPALLEHEAEAEPEAETVDEDE